MKNYIAQAQQGEQSTSVKDDCAHVARSKISRDSVEIVTETAQVQNESRDVSTLPSEILYCTAVRPSVSCNVPPTVEISGKKMWI